MTNLKIILKDDYAVIILSIISYIFFRILVRIKYKKKFEFNREFTLILFIAYLLILFFIVTYPVNEYGHNNYMGDSFNPSNYSLVPKNRISRNIYGGLFLH